MLVLIAVALATIALTTGRIPAASASQTECFNYSYACTPGYDATNTAGGWAWKYYGGSYAETPTGDHNCTLYAAWRLEQNGLGNPGLWGNASEWINHTSHNNTPAVGSIAWWGSEVGGGFGHVAYVEQVRGSEVFIRADNYDESGGYTDAGWIPASSVDAFLHPHDLQTGPPPPPPPVHHAPVDVNGDGKSDLCFASGVNGGTTGSGDLEVHCALGGGFQSRLDVATSFGYLNTQTAMPYFSDVNGDGNADMCFLTGLNGATTGSGHLEVHCALGPNFQSRIDVATPFGYLNTQTALPYFADVNGDGDADMCFLTGVNGGTTGSGGLEVHCALGPNFQSRIDVVTTFAYLNTETARPFFADVNGDGKADMCFLTGINGGTTGSGHLEVHCALGPNFQSRIDVATSFGYLNTRTAMPFFADVNGDGKADMCFLTGINGGTTGSGYLEVHCALGPDFQSRIDVATTFGYLNTETAPPFFADVNGDGKADLCFTMGVNGATTGSGDLEVHCALGPDFQSRVDVATTFGYLNTQTAWIGNLGVSAPFAPSGATASAGDRSASVSFSTPLFDGNNPINSYTVISLPGGITATGSSSPITISGLSNGTNYTFTVTATNAFGPGLPSGSSNTVTPAGAPTATTTPATRIVATTSPATAVTLKHGLLGTSVQVPAKKKTSALSSALAKCRKIKSHQKRAKCEAAAKRLYHTTKKKKR